MNKIHNILDDIYKKGYIIDYDIFTNPHETEIEILAKNPSKSEYKNIIKQIDNKTQKAIDYDFNKDNKWQTIYLIND